MSTDDKDQAFRLRFLTTPRRFMIFHLVGVRVGCTLHLESQTKQIRKAGETRPIEILEKVEGLPSVAADRKAFWEGRFGYRRGPRYDRANFAMTVPVEIRAAVGRGNKGKKRSPEHRAALLRAHTGKPLSPEIRAALSRAKKGRPLSPEHRAALSRAHKGKVLSPQQRAAISQKLKGRTLSPEHRAAIGRAIKTKTSSARSVNRPPLLRGS